MDVLLHQGYCFVVPMVCFLDGVVRGESRFAFVV